MALFIAVEVDAAVATNGELAKKLIEVCPVNIFERTPEGTFRIVDKNVDECTLCELCLDAAPRGTVRVKKLYGKQEALVRA